MRIADFDVTAMIPNDICTNSCGETTVYFDAPVEWLGGRAGEANAAEISVSFFGDSLESMGEILIWKVVENDGECTATDFLNVNYNDDRNEMIESYARIFCKLISEKGYDFNAAARISKCIMWKADCDPLKRGPWHFYEMTLSRNEFARAYNREAVCGA